MTVKQLAFALSELPASFADSQVWYGMNPIACECGCGAAKEWDDFSIGGVYANPDKPDVTLCSIDLGKMMLKAPNDKQHMQPFLR